MAGIGPNGGRQGTQYVFADGLVGLVVAAGQARNDFFAGNEVIAGKQESVVGDDADTARRMARSGNAAEGVSLPDKIVDWGVEDDIRCLTGKFRIRNVQLAAAFKIQIRFHDARHVHLRILDAVAAFFTGDDGEGPAAAQVVETGYVVAVLVSEQNVFRDEMVLRCIRVD